jgi:orotidine-5'-phosphate decarboxylase
MTFNQKLKEAVRKSQSCLCVGLDPNLERIPDSIKGQYSNPEDQVYHFLKEVIDSTADHCAAYKPNVGFFEALGSSGLNVFQKVIDYIPEEKIIIADAKRGDISSTAEHYARAYFEQFNVDAITINPLMGFETLDPFLNYPKKCAYVLTLTSNPGADDFLTRPFEGHDSMAAYISGKLATYDDKHTTHIGMVVGATKAEKISSVIQLHPKGALLIPGIGAQGGSFEDLVSALKNHEGIPLISSSRSILYAGENAGNWQQAVADKSLEFKNALQPITHQHV